MKTASERYSQPLLTKHQQLRALTGKSGEKAEEGPVERGNNGKHYGQSPDFHKDKKDK